jgi:hypothetical protein
MRIQTFGAVASALIASGCAAVPLRTAATPATFDAAELAGTWHVVATNFPMWTGGEKTNPTFNYGVLGEGRLSDVVRYREGGEVGSIEGTDSQSAEVPTHFTWRGTGLLVLFTSEWDVVAFDRAGEWAVIYFSSTLATPEGVDVITRSATPAPEALEAALNLIANDPVLSLKAIGLKKLVAP